MRGNFKISTFVLLTSPIFVDANNIIPIHQTSNNSNKQLKDGSYIVVLCVFFVLVALTTAYLIRRYGCLNPTTTITNAATNNGDDNQTNRVARGMDAREIESLPSLRFSDIKMHLVKKANDHHQLECSVCLNEFKDQEDLRLLPDCLHVFHPHCIEPWLSKHATCPVCRASLEHVHGSSASLSSILERFSGTLSERFDTIEYLDHRVVDVDQSEEPIEYEGNVSIRVDNIEDCTKIHDSSSIIRASSPEVV